MTKNITLDDAIADTESAYKAANPKSQEFYAAATGSMPGGNTRTVLHYSPFPLTFVAAEGAHVTDADGHRLLDLMGEYTAGLYGHSDPTISNAVKDALDNGIVFGGPNPLEVEFAQAICARFPAIEKVRFCNSGTEANVYALSAARAFTGRDAVIVMKDGYHGGVLYFGVDCPLNLPMPFHIVPFNDCEAAGDKIRELGQDLAAVIVEPMLGGGGCIPATEEFLTTLREQTDAVGAMLILDEVMTSRIAPGGLHGHHGIMPDMVTLGKYMGGGLTFGAFGGRADIMSRFDPREANAWPHAGTFNNNVLTMAAGLAGLTKVFTPAAVEALNAKGDYLRQRLQAAIDRHDAPVQVTGMGSMTSYHFARTPIDSPYDIPATPPALKALVHLDLIDLGYYVARRGMINLSLPTTDQDIDGFVGAFDEVLATRATVLNTVVPG